MRKAGRRMSKNERIMKNSFSRRDFIGSSALVAAAVAAPSGTLPLPRERAATNQESPIRLGLASYTFRNFSRAQLIGFMKQLNVFALNAKDVKDHLPMDPQDEAVALADYTAAGIKLHAAGAIYFPKNEDADIRSKFEYCKRADIGVIVAGDPAPETLPRIEKFVKEYDIRIAIHNRPRGQVVAFAAGCIYGGVGDGSAHGVLHRCRAHGSRRHGCGSSNPRSRSEAFQRTHEGSNELRQQRESGRSGRWHYASAQDVRSPHCDEVSRLRRSGV